jgi:hypothetical protein
MHAVNNAGYFECGWPWRTGANGPLMPHRIFFAEPGIRFHHAWVFGLSGGVFPPGIRTRRVRSNYFNAIKRICDAARELDIEKPFGGAGPKQLKQSKPGVVNLS